jgi:hypothetical protein
MGEVGLTALKTLFAMSGNVCAFQDPDTRIGCEVALTDPSWAQVNAHVCHIRGPFSESPRYDPALGENECHSFNNLILLCPSHHREIDYLRPERYPVAVLTSMKERHEACSSETAQRAPWQEERELVWVANALVAQIELQSSIARLLRSRNMGSVDEPTNSAIGYLRQKQERLAEVQRQLDDQPTA